MVNSIRKFFENDNVISVTSGAATGMWVGFMVSFCEYLKVQRQVNPHLSMRQVLGSALHRKQMLQSAPMFSFMFSCVCAIEFSTNHIVREKSGDYGCYTAPIASAINGATFLSAADHLLYRKGEGISFAASRRFFLNRHLSGFCTGFTPMLYREFLFILSVCYFGPQIGQYLKKQSGADTNIGDKSVTEWGRWEFAGIFLSALMTTTLSQPFDSLTRKMQIARHESRWTQSLTFRDAIAHNFNWRTLYAGFLPRLALATLGAALIGNSYKAIRETQKEMFRLR